MIKEEMLKVIYDKVADKTLSFGCLYEYNEGINVYVNNANQKTITLAPNTIGCTMLYVPTGSGIVQLHLNPQAQGTSPSVRFGGTCGGGTSISIINGTASFDISSSAVATSFI